jgi:D-tyrosyl-tRNA(Tyr) deacylase
MRFVIQRVDRASVRILPEEGQPYENGKIGKGFLVLIGVEEADNEKIADAMVRKLLGMRIFPDENGKTNLDLAAVNGELLLISQFTLYADCRKGNRPSFTNAAGAEQANALYEYVVAQCRASVAHVDTGVFGEHMEVDLVNNGPFTIVLDSRDLSI